MRLPSLSWRTYGLCGVLVGALILSYIPRCTDVKLHLLTKRLDFVSDEADVPLSSSPIQSLPITALTLHNFEDFSLEVKRLSTGGHAQSVRENRLTLHNPGKNGSLTMTGKHLRLLDLPLPRGAKGTLAADGADRLFVRFLHSAGSQLTIAVQEDLTLALDRVVVQDIQGKPLPGRPSSRLEIVPFTTNLIVTQQAGWALTLDVAQQGKAGTGGKLPLPLWPRLQIKQIAMQGTEQGTVVSAVQSLRIEPLMTAEQAEKPPVYVQLHPEDDFTLHSRVLTADGLECMLVGTTAMVKVGPEPKKLRNKIPSWFEYLVKHPLLEFVKQVWGMS